MLGNRIKALRKAAKMNQEELAKKIGVGRTTITEYESERIVPSLDKIQAMSNVFGVPVSSLTGDDVDGKPQDLTLQLEKIIDDLKNGSDFQIDGQTITQGQKDGIALQLESTIRMIRYFNSLNTL